MNIYDYLIIKTNNSAIEDITSSIKSIEFYKDNNGHNKTKVIYNSSPNKVYPFDQKNILFFDNPKKIDTSEVTAYHDNIPIYGEIIDFGEYIKVINNEKGQVYEKNKISFHKSCMNKNNVKEIFNYFKDISYILDKDCKIDSEEDGKDNFGPLSRKYNEINKIDEETSLGTYLSNAKIKNFSNKITPIFPFGLNLSQKNAVKNALQNQISIIEGPPGTGKTQTILNIIANLIINDKTVAIVSGNNSATENVQEKLNKNNFGFFTAMLGNSNNQEDFFNNKQTEVPDMNKWAKSYKEILGIEKNIKKTAFILDDFLKDQNEKAKLKEEISSLKTEYKHFIKNFTNKIKPLHKISFFKEWKSKNITSLLIYLNEFAVKPSIIIKIILFFKFSIYKFSNLKNNMLDISISLNNMYYKKSIYERETRIKDIEKKHKNRSSQALINSYIKNSEITFKAKLSKIFSDRKREIYKKKMFKSNFKNFIKDYPVILSTTNSILNSIPKDYVFDYLIIDEASQVNLVTASLSMICCKNIIIVGDLKQLPQIISKNSFEEDNKVFNKETIPHQYKYSEHNIMSSLISLYEDDIPKTLLREHYRCHPKIINFCNKQFYNNELVIMTNEKENDTPLKIYKTAKGNHSRNKKGSSYSLRQIQVIKDEVLKNEDISNGVGITSPYRLQVNELIKHLSNKQTDDEKIDLLQKSLKEKNIEIDTVHKFQGREKSTIIFSSVVDHINDFADNENLINVAVSRSEKEFILVTSDNLFKKHDSNIGNLIRYIEYNSNQEDIKTSKIISVFDLLYSSYSEELLKLKPFIKNISLYKSENIMHGLIKEILQKPEFSSFKFLIHIPLFSLVNDFSILNEEEQKFARNPLSHIDFIIFNKMDKEPVLAIEVDGHKFHENNPKQKQRDNTKNNIFNKIKIPLCRFSTNDSNEEERLTKILEDIIKTSKD